MTKKYLIIVFVISAGVAFGAFLFAPVSKTLYIKNSASYLASADINHAENKIGDLSNTIIPSINVPKNITEDFAASLTQELISKNQNISVVFLIFFENFRIFFKNLYRQYY